jgi:hypothetical protein
LEAIPKIYLHIIYFGKTMKLNTKILLYLIVFAFLDMIIPIPFTAIILIYVISEKPPWFKKLVTDIYASGNI